MLHDYDKKFQFLSLVIVFVLLMSSASAWAMAGKQRNVTVSSPSEFIESLGFSKGICTVLGGQDKDLILDITKSSEFLIHVIDPSPSTAAELRRALQSEGVNIKRVIVEAASIDGLPYAGNMIDAVISMSVDDKAMRAEVMRVLRPGGMALLDVSNASADLTPFTKPATPGADEWTHWNYGPDNNPLSKDSVIKAPYMTQWMDGPYFIAMPAVTTIAGGKTFTAMGHIAHHKREEPWLYTLLARNAYNGSQLWRRKLPEGYMVHRSAFIATSDVFYMIDGDRALMLNPETGQDMGELRIPKISGAWKWMAMQDGILYVLAGENPDVAETKLARHFKTHWSWGKLSKGYYGERVPWGFGQTITA
ncbi:class I SAM-dependent methyltransferase, partial [Candidatus Hydrogenedentota bacterium]